MATQKEYIQLISQLALLTQSKQLRWERIEGCPQDITTSGGVVDDFYITRHKDRNLRLYEVKFKNYYDEFDYNWGASVIIEMVDSNYEPIWQFPSLLITLDLFKAVKYQESGVDKFIDDVLKDVF